jgi:hypothetical protein
MVFAATPYNEFVNVQNINTTVFHAVSPVKRVV